MFQRIMSRLFGRAVLCLLPTAHGRAGTGPRLIAAAISFPAAHPHAEICERVHLELTGIASYFAPARRVITTV
jgi:hypothetical protein